MLLNQFDRMAFTMSTRFEISDLFCDDQIPVLRQTRIDWEAMQAILN